MGLVTHTVKRSDLKAGDHIYTWRNLYTYSHHGIYVGENKVVHFTLDQDSSSSYCKFSSTSSSIPTVPITCLDYPDSSCSKTKKSGVIISCLNCFLQSGSLHRFEYGVSFAAFTAKIRGGCTAAKSDPPELVIHRAMYLLRNGFGDYDLIENNCEDFALYCKTGRYVFGGRNSTGGSSGQVRSALGVPASALLCLPLRKNFPNPVILTATAACCSLSRYFKDIGVRDDATQVNVEDLASIRRNRVGLKILALI